MIEPSGHQCPKCNCKLVYVERFARNDKGTFYNLYKCTNCGNEFENTPSHKERDNER